jgi:hypothetical protein
MIIDWSLKTIKEEVVKIRFAEGDKYMDGFTTWGCKKDLYEILWYVEKALDKCDTYSNEDDFIEEHDKELMWSILKGKKK